MFNLMYQLICKFPQQLFDLELSFKVAKRVCPVGFNGASYGFFSRVHIKVLESVLFVPSLLLFTLQVGLVYSLSYL